ncbi:4'-phosphopantetheinyl transferase superfamily protein [Streptomyces sp. NPDC002044]|uniref:4'-phosphopantetheinyl transferase family protein n=1 Tax=Streptomyces sp. NPDC002044 TaxID=3154662 RepID=UPI00331C4F28
MIEQLLPYPVHVVSAVDDPPGPGLFPAEEALIANAVESRRNEFTTGRRCARQALSKLGHPVAPLLSGTRGEPLWPPGVRGSITHCEGYRAAAVARGGDLFSLGMDVERVRVVPPGVFEAVSSRQERSLGDRYRRHLPAVPWELLLFSAKESVYKAWFPLTGRSLGFEEAAVEFDPYEGTFEARLLVPGPRWGDSTLGGFSGRWAVRPGFVLTAVTVPVPPAGGTTSR